MSYRESQPEPLREKYYSFFNMKTLIFIISGLLYRIGGSDKEKIWPYGVDKKGARILLLPFVLAVYMAIAFKNWHYLYMILTMQVLRLGDGIPCPGDEGSFMGRLFRRPWLTSAVVQAISALATYSIKFALNPNLDNLILYCLINALTAGIIKYLDVVYIKYGDVITEMSRGFALSSIIYI